MSETETQTVLSPEFQALISRVQEIGKANHDNLVAENRKMMAEALGQVSGSFKAPIAPQGNGAAEPGAEKPAEAPPTASPGRIGSLLARFGLSQVPAHQVSKTRREMLDEIRIGKPSMETLMTAEAGHQAVGIDAAFERSIVTGPKRGLSGWQIVGLAAAGTVVVGGAVVGGMYLTETGLFAPTPDEG